MGRAAAAFFALWVGSGCNLVLGIEELSNESSGVSPSAGGGGEGGNGGGGGMGGDGATATGGGGAEAGGGGMGGEGGMGGGCVQGDLPDVVAATGSGSSGFDVGIDIAATAGRAALVGMFGADTTLFGSPLSGGGVYVVSLDELGAPQFGVSLGGSSDPVVAATAGQTFVAASYGTASPESTGAMPTGVLVRGFNLTGAELDTYLYQAPVGASVEVHGIAVNASGDVAVVGAFRGTVTFDGAPHTSVGLGRNVYAAVYDSGGERWLKTFGSSATTDAVANAVAFDSTGRVVVTGRQEGGLDLGGGEVAGSGMFVVRLEPEDGAHASAAPVVPNAGGRSIAGASAGRLVVAGFTSNAAAMIGSNPVPPETGFVFGLGAANAVTFVRPLAGLEKAAPIDVDVASDTVVVGGSFPGAITFAGEAFSSAGQLDLVVGAFELGVPVDQWLWAESYGGGAGDVLGAISAGGAQLVATGSYDGSWCFGGALLPQSSGQDVFVAGLEL